MQLADSHFHILGKIDMILGADIYGQLIEEGIVKGPVNSPIAQRTKLGWIMSGPIQESTKATAALGLHVSVNHDLYELLRRFWTSNQN